MGDSVMAFWGAPLDDPDHAEHAVQAGLAMVARMTAINEILDDLAEDFDLDPLCIGVGINSGECVVGNMGSGKRFDYSVLGDVVNIASRLENLSKVYGVPIIVGEGAARRLSPDYLLKEIDRVAVRGRLESQPVYVIEMKSPATMQRCGAPTVMVSGAGFESAASRPTAARSAR